MDVSAALTSCLSVCIFLRRWAWLQLMSLPFLQSSLFCNLWHPPAISCLLWVLSWPLPLVSFLQNFVQKFIACMILFFLIVIIIFDFFEILCHFINWVNLEFYVHSCLIMDDDVHVFIVIFHFLGTENVCDKVTCGKGKCKASQNSTFFYECECDLGWKQNTMADDQNLKFLPCIVPNCDFTLYLQLWAGPSFSVNIFLLGICILCVSYEFLSYFWWWLRLRRVKFSSIWIGIVVGFQ